MIDLMAVWNMYSQYVFGSAALAALFLLVFIVLTGIRFGWSLATYLVVLVPAFVLTSRYLSVNLQSVFLLGVGMLIGIAMLVLIKR